MATVAKSMPQFGLLMIMTLIPLQMLSGAMTPRESMPEMVQNIMLLAPDPSGAARASHFIPWCRYRSGMEFIFMATGDWLLLLLLFTEAFSSHH